MANIRWARDRARRAQLAALPPEVMPGQISRRIIVIDWEWHAHEIIIRSWDSPAEARRKIRSILDAPIPTTCPLRRSRP